MGACHRPVATREKSDAAYEGGGPAGGSPEAGVQSRGDAPDAGAVRDGGATRACAGANDPIMSFDDVYFTPISPAALRPIDRSLFPADQLSVKKRWEYKAPDQVALQGVDGGKPPLLVMGDATWSTCEIFVAGEQVKGPFAGVPSSADWTAQVYQGTQRVVVVVSNAEAHVRALRAFQVGQVSCGFSLSRMEAFPDGAALHVSSYVSADGDSLKAEGVYGLASGKLTELFLATASEPTGAVDTFTVTPGPPGPRPTLTVRLKAHPAPKGEPLGSMSKAIDRTWKATWDPKAQVFR
jgi:hypothetical protein